MAKLYVFGIGGTGARVLKSLSFLLASGVRCESSSIVPILIDPDAANGDVNKTVDILKLYQRIREKLSFEGKMSNRFFGTEISPLNQSCQIEIPETKKKFKEFIEFQELDRRNKALISLLFSKKNLDANLEVGFKGNPNMGSVVLNQFNTSEDFAAFASSFAQGDRIFIISSIFGGTGAAGFPLLMKTVRSATPNLDNYQLLREAPIGAVSVLPYFGVKKEEESEIEKSTFISKTKAALRYYEHGVNNSVNSMYYIGDKLVKDYDNAEGSVSQQNDAHFVELASALAILDFANDAYPMDNKVKEFGLENETAKIIFNDLGDATKSDILRPLAKYYLFNLYLKNHLSENLGARFAKELKFDDSFIGGDFYRKLSNFNGLKWEWLEQMNSNQRGFSPFTLSNDNDLFNSIKGIKPKKAMFEKTKNFERFTTFLNKESIKYNTSMSLENRFMGVFGDTTERLFNDKFKL